MQRGLILPIIVILIALITVVSGGYLLYQNKVGKPAETKQLSQPTLSPTNKPTLNPNSGNLYTDIKIRMKEVLK